jgi:hypothetical protein
VVGAIGLLPVIGITWGVITMQRAMRDKSPSPWAVLAEELAADLRGGSVQPAAEVAPESEPEPEFDPYYADESDER